MSLLKPGHVRVFYPRIEFCTDNAAMIAVAGMARLKAGRHEPPAIRARASWPLAELTTNSQEAAWATYRRQ